MFIGSSEDKMECRPLEITLISARDIKYVNTFSKMDVYAEVSINGDHYTSKQKQKTPIDKECGTNPKWNYTMNFTVHETSLQDNRLTIGVKLISDRHLGDKEIGEVHVPIKELLDHKAGDGILSYGVRTPSGKSKGTLDFSFEFGEKFEAPLPPQEATNVNDSVMAYLAPASYPGTGASSAYPPRGAYPPRPPPPYMEAGNGHVGAYLHAYPPPGGYPPPPHGYGGYPPPAPGYGGYPGYPPAGGYPPMMQQPLYSAYPRAGGYPPIMQEPQYPRYSWPGGSLGELFVAHTVSGAGNMAAGGMISVAGGMAGYDSDACYDGDGFDF